MELKELCESRGRADCGSSSWDRSKDCKYVERNDEREVSVVRVALYVCVDVSRHTMILLRSMAPFGAGESRIGSKTACGGEDGMLTGSAGTGGNSSRTLNEDSALGLDGLVVKGVSGSS